MKPVKAELKLLDEQDFSSKEEELDSFHKHIHKIGAHLNMHVQRYSSPKEANEWNVLPMSSHLTASSWCRCVKALMTWNGSTKFGAFVATPSTQPPQGQGKLKRGPSLLTRRPANLRALVNKAGPCETLLSDTEGIDATNVLLFFRLPMSSRLTASSWCRCVKAPMTWNGSTKFGAFVATPSTQPPQGQGKLKRGPGLLTRRPANLRALVNKAGPCETLLSDTEGIDATNVLLFFRLPMSSRLTASSWCRCVKAPMTWNGSTKFGAFVATPSTQPPQGQGKLKRGPGLLTRRPANLRALVNKADAFIQGLDMCSHGITFKYQLLRVLLQWNFA
ncbi:UNVERIFIED_CONTAM: hypothetical protein FKN15_006569 [Acipenser sinensis]